MAASSNAAQLPLKIDISNSNMLYLKQLKVDIFVVKRLNIRDVLPLASSFCGVYKRKKCWVSNIWLAILYTAT